MTGSEEQHNKRLEKLIKNPEIIISDELYFSTKEINFYREDGNLHSEPDMIAFTRQGELYLIEYKCSSGRRDKGIEQLNREEEFIIDMGFTCPIKKLLIYGKYHVEEIK